jgi:hypothetical protein
MVEAWFIAKLVKNLLSYSWLLWNQMDTITDRFRSPIARLGRRLGHEIGYVSFDELRLGNTGDSPVLYETLQRGQVMQMADGLYAVTILDKDGNVLGCLPTTLPDVKPAEDKPEMAIPGSSILPVQTKSFSPDSMVEFLRYNGEESQTAHVGWGFRVNDAIHLPRHVFETSSHMVGPSKKVISVREVGLRPLDLVRGSDYCILQMSETAGKVVKDLFSVMGLSMCTVDVCRMSRGITLCHPGFPGSKVGKQTSGMITRRYNTAKWSFGLLHTASTSPGWSGLPVFQFHAGKYKVVGMHVASRGSESLNICLSTATHLSVKNLLFKEDKPESSPYSGADGDEAYTVEENVFQRELSYEEAQEEYFMQCYEKGKRFRGKRDSGRVIFEEDVKNLTYDGQWGDAVDDYSDTDENALETLPQKADLVSDFQERGRVKTLLPKRSEPSQASLETGEHLTETKVHSGSSEQLAPKPDSNLSLAVLESLKDLQNRLMSLEATIGQIKQTSSPVYKSSVQEHENPPPAVPSVRARKKRRNPPSGTESQSASAKPIEKSSKGTQEAN